MGRKQVRKMILTIEMTFPSILENSLSLKTVELVMGIQSRWVPS